MGLELPVPDHTTLARRRRRVAVEMNAPGRHGPVDLVLDSTGLKFHGPTEWDRLKHCGKRLASRKLHLAVDAATGEILAHALTDSDTADVNMVGSLVGRAGGRIRSVIADGAYDGAPVYAAIRAVRPPRWPPKIVVPPSAPSIPTRGVAHGGTERERHAPQIAARGRIEWQKAHGYGLRSLGETAISRLKARGGDRLTARNLEAQRKEAALRISTANKAIRYPKPFTVRIA